MEYAVWIALAVVALAIVPPILKNRRAAQDKAKGDGGSATSGDAGAAGDCSGAGGDSCGGDGGGGD